MKRSARNQSIDEFLDSEYHTREPLFPETVRDQDTDDYLAWRTGRTAIKASHVVFFKIKILLYRSITLDSYQPSHPAAHIDYL